MSLRTVFIGYDPREAAAVLVAQRSLLARAAAPVDVRLLSRTALEATHLYDRQVKRRGGQLWDVPSKAPMSTEHANARFAMRLLAAPDAGWALFVDGDVLFRDDVHKLFDLADERFAVMCVQHQMPKGKAVKKAGAAQVMYPRKNWSSVMLWNFDHPAHQALSINDMNKKPGRELHAFSWLKDDLIGALPQDWNHLVGVTPASYSVKLAHFTLGIPSIKGYENSQYADEWRAYL